MKFSVTQVIILSVTLVGLVSAARSLAGLARKLAENKAEPSIAAPISDESLNTANNSITKTAILNGNELASSYAEVAESEAGGGSMQGATKSLDAALSNVEMQTNASLTMTTQQFQNEIISFFI